MNRKIMVAGNWKLNNTVGQAIDLVDDLKKRADDVHKVDVIVAPPFTAIKSVYDALSDSSIQVAGQNLFWEESGAFTGEISPFMLKEAGCKWVIIGHSERRQYFGESNESVNKRVRAALTSGALKAIICIGETLEEREADKTFDILDSQLAGALLGVDVSEMDKVVIAYEPVWAIGTGKTATPEMADEAHAHIRNKLKSLYGSETAVKVRILYGGSVKPDNAEELFGKDNIDGGLIGGASLKATDFIAIIKAGLAVSE